MCFVLDFLLIFIYENVLFEYWQFRVWKDLYQQLFFFLYGSFLHVADDCIVIMHYKSHVNMSVFSANTPRYSLWGGIVIHMQFSSFSSLPNVAHCWAWAKYHFIGKGFIFRQYQHAVKGSSCMNARTKVWTKLYQGQRPPDHCLCVWQCATVLLVSWVRAVRTS